MSLYQLKKIFEHFHSEFDPSPDAVQQLKKKVLLHLKSSESGFLEIYGKQWSKSDLLELFESDISELRFDLDALKQLHPDLGMLENPAGISRSMQKDLLEKIQPELEQIHQYYSQVLCDNFYFAVRKDVEALKFLSASYKLSYIELFDPISKREIISKLQSQVIHLIRFSGGQKIKSVKFILEIDYYVFLGELGKHDPAFLMDHFNEMGFWIRRMTNHQRRTFFNFQKQLPYSAYDLILVKNSAHNLSITESQRPDFFTARNWQLLMMVIMLSIFLYYFWFRDTTGRSTPYNRPPSTAEEQMKKNKRLKKMYKEIGIDKDDNQDSIREKIKRVNNKN